MEGQGRPARPIVVVEGPDHAVAAAMAELERAGWRIRPGFEGIGQVPPGLVRAGVVTTQEEAGAALLAALGGAGVVIAARADRPIIDRLVDDLRHLGPVDHRIGSDDRALALREESRQLLERLAAGDTLGEAAHALSLSRRTADRRLAEARRALGAERTAEAVARARRAGLLR